MAEIQSKTGKGIQAFGCLSIVAGLLLLLKTASDPSDKYGVAVAWAIGGGVLIYLCGWAYSWWNHG